jgi:hypothetical protein
MKVTKDHFLQAAKEIGKSGENDTLPYDIDAGFLRDKAEELSTICFDLFKGIDARNQKNAVGYVNELTVASERLLAPSGSNGFRIILRVLDHPTFGLTG